MNARSAISRRRPFARSAAALLLVACLGTSSAFAQATWVGDTSQNWNTAANWSSDPAAPTGNFTVNTAAEGVFPVLSAASAFTPVDILIGSGAGQVGRLDVNAGNVATGGPNWLLIGTQGGTGTLNIAAGATVTGRVHMAHTLTTGTGTINVNGTLASAGEVVIADGLNATATAIGTLNVNSGGTVNSEGDLLLAFAGNSSTTGTVNLAAGGTINVASTLKRWVIINQWDATRGRLNVSGGTLNLNADTDIRFSIGNGVGVSSLTLDSGAINGGPGSVLDFNLAGGSVNNTVNLNGGTLSISQLISTIASGTRVLNLNGGTLRPTASGTFLAATSVSAANVRSGGAVFDTNGFDITVARALLAAPDSPGGGLTKLGAGTLTLSGVNTYTGNTTVSAGTLVLADNAALRLTVGTQGVNTRLTGSGAVTLAGDLDLDLTAASTTLGHSWQLVDVASLAETYAPTFSLATFSLEGGKWIKPANGAFYEFDPATGTLTVVNDPGVTFPPPTVELGAHRPSYVLGSDFSLSVNATGSGTLSYQWFYQADSSATPTPIAGATGATYLIAGASSASGGIYSVTVTDSAAPGTPTTVAFPAIAVLPGTAYTAAYYRFEEGTAAAFITTATDSSAGATTLTALGTPNYAEDSLPYAVIPRTGTANTLGANFPAAGAHGLIAPVTGALASTEFRDFTIEAFVRLDTLGGWQTIVGRDDSGLPGQGGGDQALFYLTKAGGPLNGGLNNAFRVELIDRSGANLQVNSAEPSLVPVAGTWYHVAAVGDSAKGTLTLYVNGTVAGSTTGFTGLFVPAAGSDTPWTLGRGDFGTTDVDFLRGDLDEVRFSTVALPPSQFLNATDGAAVVNPTVSVAPAARTVALGASVTLAANATSNMGGTLAYQWSKDGAPLPGETSATLAFTADALDDGGVYSVKVTDSSSTAAGFPITAESASVVRVITLPAAGRRSLGLNFVGTAFAPWSEQLGVLTPDYVAGIYPAANWNNSANVNGLVNPPAPLALAESDGSATFATATWTAGNTWAARGELGALETKSEHGRLLHGYIESRAATGATVTFSNIPYASYEVFVYVSGGTVANHVGSVSLSRPGTQTRFYQVLQNDTTRLAAPPSEQAPYSPAPMLGDAADIASALAAPPASFVRFTGVTGTELTISVADAVLGANAGGLAAVQIVDTTAPGTAYPPSVLTAPASVLRAGGSSVRFSVSAVSNNPGGVITYQWRKGPDDLPGQTSATLALANLTAADVGDYTVVVTDTSSLGVSTTTRTASLVVVDATRPLLLNGDLNTAASPTVAGLGILRANGATTAADLGSAASTWNGLVGAVGAATLTLARDHTGLAVPGLTFSYAGAQGVEDNLVVGNISGSVSEALVRDYLYTDAQNVPLTGSVGGLSALAGKKFTLVVYAYGKLSTAFFETTESDTATVTLAAANNHLGTTPRATSTSDFGGRNLSDNNLETTGGESAAYVTFEGVVAFDGTVSWSIGPDADSGRIPLVGFQLLVTNEDVAPPVPTDLTTTLDGANVALSWSPSAGATSYTVRRATVSGGPYTTLSAGVITGTAYTDSSAAPGTTYHYVVAAANALATSADSAEASVTTPAPADPILAWRVTYFGSSADSGPGANTADPDADGLPNLLEYALGSNPQTANASPATVGVAGGRLTLAFTPVVDANLTYAIEASNDLAAGWSVVLTYPAFTSAAPVTYTDTVALTANPRRFLRLAVTRAQ